MFKTDKNAAKPCQTSFHIIHIEQCINAIIKVCNHIYTTTVLTHFLHALLVLPPTQFPAASLKPLAEHAAFSVFYYFYVHFS